MQPTRGGSDLAESRGRRIACHSSAVQSLLWGHDIQIQYDPTLGLHGMHELKSRHIICAMSATRTSMADNMPDLLLAKISA